MTYLFELLYLRLVEQGEDVADWLLLGFLGFGRRSLVTSALSRSLSGTFLSLLFLLLLLLLFLVLRLRTHRHITMTTADTLIVFRFHCLGRQCLRQGRI